MTSRCAPAFWPHPILATAGAKTGGEDPTPTPAPASLPTVLDTMPLFIVSPRGQNLSLRDPWLPLPWPPPQSLTQPQGSICVQLRGAQWGGASHRGLVAHLKGTFPLFPGAWVEGGHQGSRS